MNLYQIYCKWLLVFLRLYFHLLLGYQPSNYLRNNSTDLNYWRCNFAEMAMNCWAQFGEQDFDLDKILERVIVCSPQSYSELTDLLYNIKYFTKHRKVSWVAFKKL